MSQQIVLQTSTSNQQDQRFAKLSIRGLAVSGKLISPRSIISKSQTLCDHFPIDAKIVEQITEVVFGIICVIVGIVAIALTVINVEDYPNLSFGYRDILLNSNYGEGIWCGIWIIAAGGVGIRVGGNNSSACLINAHMALCIVGAVFSAVIVGLSAYQLFIFPLELVSILAVRIVLLLCSFTSLVLLIVSSSLACCWTGCCGDQDQAGQVVYVPTKP